VAKVKMPMSVHGSSALSPRYSRGFTLLELMIVLLILGIASAAVAFAMSSGPSRALQQEGERLAAILEAGRAQSRTTGVSVYFQPREGGFALASAAGTVTRSWMISAVTVSPSTPLALGPDPIIAAHRLGLMMEGQTVVVATNGVAPFAVEASTQAAP
jgi:general secretion pathway protein H